MQTDTPGQAHVHCNTLSDFALLCLKLMKLTSDFHLCSYISTVWLLFLVLLLFFTIVFAIYFKTTLQPELTITLDLGLFGGHYPLSHDMHLHINFISPFSYAMPIQTYILHVSQLFYTPALFLTGNPGALSSILNLNLIGCCQMHTLCICLH